MIVNEHTWTSEGSGPVGETTTHVSISTLHLSGLRRRYRHFVRQSDGAILEVRDSHANDLLASRFLELQLPTVDQRVQEHEEEAKEEEERGL